MNQESLSLKYSRRLFDNVMDWYKNADSKGQILLTLNGVFLAFLTNSVFMEQDKLTSILSQFGVETWFLLILMCFTMSGSVLSSILCFWSRTYNKYRLNNILKNNGVDITDADTYKPQFMLFFQFLSRLDGDTMAQKLAVIDERFEVDALAHEIKILSENVLKKHSWVNIGFALAGISLLLFLSVGISYVVRVNW